MTPGHTVRPAPAGHRGAGPDGVGWREVTGRLVPGGHRAGGHGGVGRLIPCGHGGGRA